MPTMTINQLDPVYETTERLYIENDDDQLLEMRDLMIVHRYARNARGDIPGPLARPSTHNGMYTQVDWHNSLSSVFVAARYERNALA